MHHDTPLALHVPPEPRPATDHRPPPGRSPVVDSFRADGPDLFRKCAAFTTALQSAGSTGGAARLYRITLTSGLDHRVRARDPFDGTVREYVCFDSNSYLGLHRDPRVVTAVHRTLDVVGAGTPSAQLLGGTNVFLRALEEVVSDFHGREDCMVFPSGYAACGGALVGILRRQDSVFIDQFAHASLHDGVAASTAKRRVWAHRDMGALAHRLDAETGSHGGKLIVTDGIFSMHGTMSPLPELRRIATASGAALLMDEAHSTGIMGPRGRGLEDHFALPGAIDVLVGTFSKAAGGVGGYVCGSKELITYLRFFARSGVFTAALPAATCAGLTVAFQLMRDDPGPREQLWENTTRLSSMLRDVGIPVPFPPESPILAIPVGETDVLLRVSEELLRAGIKVGGADYPAVPAGEAILRLAVNARHTAEDLSRVTEALADVSRRHGLLDRYASACSGDSDAFSHR